LISTLGIATLIVAGCNPTTQRGAASSMNPGTANADPIANVGHNNVAGAKSANTSPESDSEHGHKPGAHGGIMVSLGRDSYHVEAVIDSEGTIRLYTLGRDESRVIDVENQSLQGFVKANGDAESKSMVFEPSPQDGDSKNKTSLFIGKLPQEMVGRQIDLTIPNIRIDGERFRLGFQSSQESHGESEMPDKVADNEERELYLQPGGRYTAADIKANGNVTASQKFKGFRAKHDMHPKPGDLICPITETKANPNCSWVVDGKKYDFCCPPCVDEFVKMAKAATDALPEPDSYVKK
jgi:hypothetical protein